MAKKVSSKEIGLILGAKLLKTEDLHYGFWSDNLELKLGNLPQAQQRYTEFLAGHIPKDVKTILDVGCGTGHVSQVLLEKGYRMQAISPSPELTRLALERLGPDFTLHQTTLEDFRGDKRFDLMLFSESYQYIPLAESFAQALALLRPGGYVLIADFFRTDAPGESPLRGGHDMKQFYAMLAEQPFKVLSDKDITPNTAPNLDLVDQLLQDYAVPIWETTGYYLSQNYPRLSGLLGRVFKKRLDRLQYKYFSRKRTAANFTKYKCYRCLLLQRIDS